MGRASKNYPGELRERAVLMVAEIRAEYPSEWAAIESVAKRLEGVFNGSQTNGQFVPEQQTDFVFTVVAEETGFVGSATLLLLLTSLSLRALTVARNALDGDRLMSFEAGDSTVDGHEVFA